MTFHQSNFLVVKLQCFFFVCVCVGGGGGGVLTDFEILNDSFINFAKCGNRSLADSILQTIYL